MYKRSLFVFYFLSTFFGIHTGIDVNATIKTAQGQRPLKQLEVGDRVTCYSPSGTVEKARITALRDVQTSVVEVVFARGARLLVTPEQKFFSALHNQWVDAGELELGDRLICLSGLSDEVSAIKEVPGKKWLRDISVDQHHTFFVGELGILTHNFAIEITILTWGGGLAMTWFEGVTIAGLATTIAGLVAKECLVEGVKMTTGKDIRKVVNVAEQVGRGTVQQLEQEAAKKDYRAPNHARDITLEINSDGVTCPGREISKEIELIHSSPIALAPQRLELEGFDRTPPRSLVCPGFAILPPEKGSTIITVEKIQEYDPPVRVPKTIQDILAGAELWKRSYFSEQYNYLGNYEDAKAHFYSLGPTNIIDMGGGFIRGTLPDGRHINIRQKASNDVKKTGGGFPTLEIQKGDTKIPTIKIRYIKDRYE